MSKSRKPPANKDNALEKAAWVGFHNVNLSDDMKARINATYEGGMHLCQQIAELSKYGYKVSFGYDYYRGSPMVTVYGQMAWCKNAGVAVNFIHADVMKCFYIAFWYTAVYHSYDEWPKVQKAEEEQVW